APTTGRRYRNRVMPPSTHDLPQALPDLLDRIEIGAVAADLVGRAGAVDLRRDDLRHPPRPARQQHDAVGQIDRFLDAVGDEDEGLALDLAQAQQILLELPPCL